ncbi:FAS-associated factor 2 protein [Dioscorea alata]|uniref:FAS-associated factor 2 protein n=1 Tax=Dioscorea alata TaxID=55571 RepID=A0ACB7WUW7_DIOAL|nr:FAS-associated factor 2 protein [Dioscorea alata]
MADLSREEKLACFQSITGLQDLDLCTEILAAHGWDLELAITSITSTVSPNAHSQNPNPSSSAPPSGLDLAPSASPGLAWRLATLPFYVVSGGVGLVAGAVGLGFWVAGGLLNRSLNLIGLLPRDQAAAHPLVPFSPPASEADDFVTAFGREYGAGAPAKPDFVSEGFSEALRRSQRGFRPLFVYLHSPDHPDVPAFCHGCLCSALVAEFLNENFVCWGGNIRGIEGFNMSNNFRASSFPYCAIVWVAGNQQMELLGQIEGLKSPEEMLVILQQVTELSTPTLLAARLQDEDRRDNLRLREEQDAAYREALEADQVCIFLTHYLKGLFLICSPAKVLYSSPARNFSHKCFSRAIHNICKTNSIKQSQHLQGYIINDISVKNKIYALCIM